MMIDIEFPRLDDGTVPAIRVSMPVVPRSGEWLEHEPTGLKGFVVDTQYWFNEAGELKIMVRMR